MTTFTVKVEAKFIIEADTEEEARTQAEKKCMYNGGADDCDAYDVRKWD